MSSFENKAAIIRCPVAFDGTNNFGVWKLDADTTHKASVCPSDWSNRIVAFIAVGGVAHFALAKNNASAEVDRTVASSDDGAQAKVGLPIVDSSAAPGMSSAVHVQMPNFGADQYYFVREATADNTVIWAWLASP